MRIKVHAIDPVERTRLQAAHQGPQMGYRCGKSPVASRPRERPKAFPPDASSPGHSCFESPRNVAMEACGSAHHCGRWFAARGHPAHLVAANFEVPFWRGSKNDAADAEAVAVAARQPMRFVPIKTVDQQAILVWHNVRGGWTEERTALLNRVRGLLAEYGVVSGR